MKKINSCAIIGQGALGILFGKQIYDEIGAEAVRFIADRDRVERYQREGIKCNGVSYAFKYAAPDGPFPADLIIFAVKGPQLAGAIDQVRNFIAPDTILISVLNGISSEEAIGAAFGKAHLLYAIAQGMDATRFGGALNYTKPGQILFGSETNEKTDDVLALADFFDRAKIAYTIPQDIRLILWNKFMLNVGVNQAVTAYETTYGGIQVDGEARDTMIAAMREVIPIADRLGVKLTEEHIQGWLSLLGSFNTELMPSMRQDAISHRKTEVELFSGAVIRMANELGLECPVNHALYERITALENRYL